jgi:predicted ABC-type ATPase
MDAGALLIVAGPPGAGKSTVARLLADAVDRSVLVESDAFFAFLAAGAIPPWLPESDAQNHVVTEAAARATAAFVSAGYDTYYDGVMGPWFLSHFMDAAGLVELDYVVLLPPVEATVGRVAARRGHGFTDEEATRSMHRAFVADPVDERHLIRDSEATPAEIASMVTLRRAGGLLRARR